MRPPRLRNKALHRVCGHPKCMDPACLTVVDIRENLPREVYIDSTGEFVDEQPKQLPGKTGR